MTVFICVDDCGGVAFNNRRQSRDSKVIADVAGFGCGRLLVTGYSAPLFTGENATVSEDPFSEAGEGDGVFAELVDVSEHLCKTDALVIYRWNRRYPSDVRFTADPEEQGFRLESAAEFAGTSHEKIMREVWRRG